MALIDKLNAIGDAIREKTSKTDKMTLDEMPNEIRGIEGGAEGGQSTPTQEKTVDITKNGTVEVIPDEGYVLSKVTANVDIPPVEILLQDKWITPTEEEQEVVADEGYTGLGIVYVEPIPSEYVRVSGTTEIIENGEYDIKQYERVIVNVPKPSGTLEITENGTYDVTEKASVVVSITGGTNTESEEVAGLLSNTMTVLDNSLVTSLRTRVCQSATKLVTVNLPNVTSLGAYAFYQCSNLETVTLPKLTTISTQTWYMCPKLQYADCGQLNSITAQTFASCTALKTLILRKTSSICTLSNANGVSGSGIGKGTGFVYVPAALIETYKTATNWSTVASQFRAIEDYPDITGG